jgi:hypothetical protein
MKFFITILLCFVIANTLAQNVGIGTNAPQRSLHINSGTLLVTGDTGTAPTLGAGAKFLWVPAKSALRAGYTSAAGSWNHANIGQYSFSFGNQSNAPGIYGLAGGNAAFANGDNALALGTSVNANADNSSAIGRNLTANAYNSFVIGRYNETSGDNTNWVETDPLLVVGNGYLTNVGGFPITTRRDAFKILKNGNSLFNGSATINNNLSVNNLLQVSGKTTFYDSVTLNDDLVLSNGRDVFAHKSGGTNTQLSMVPIGVVKVNVVYTVPPVFLNPSTCEATFTNLFGNLVLSEIHSCQPGGIFSNSELSLTLNFNQSITNQYNEIIAVPSLTFDGVRTSAGEISLMAMIRSEVTKNITTSIPEKYHTGFTVSSMNEVGDWKIFGTVMFYGLKN